MSIMVQSTLKRKGENTMGFTTTAANALLTEQFRSDSNVYIGFSTSEPTESNGTLTNFSEPQINASTGYTRGILNTSERKLMDTPDKKQIQNKSY